MIATPLSECRSPASGGIFWRRLSERWPLQELSLRRGDSAKPPCGWPLLSRAELRECLFSSKNIRAPLKPRGLRLGGFAWAARVQNYVAFELALVGLDLLNNPLPLDASILLQSPRDAGVARELCRGQPLAKEAAFKGAVGDGQEQVDPGLVAVGDAPHEGCPAMVGLGIGIADRQEQGHAFKVAGHRGMHEGSGAIGGLEKRIAEWEKQGQALGAGGARR